MASGPRVGRDVILLGVLVLVLVIGMSLRQSNATDEQPRPGSTSSAKPVGAQALYMLLGRLGYSLGRSSERLAGFDEVRLAFLISPEQSLGPADLAGLRAWIERGGTLIYGYSPDEPDSKPLHDVLGIEIVATPDVLRTGSLRLSADFRPATRLNVPLSAVLRPRRDQEGFQPIALDDFSADERADRRGSIDRRIVAMMSVGEGRVIALPAGLLSNKLLGDADNAVFLAVLAERYAGAQPVVFDEWSHGEGGTTSVLHLAGAPLDAAAALLVLAFLLYAAAGRHLGPPSREPAPARRATIEQVEALARFYQKTGARQAALGVLGIASAAPPRSDAELCRIVRAAVSQQGA